MHLQCWWGFSILVFPFSIASNKWVIVCQLQQQHFFFIEWVFFHFIFMVSHLCFISLYLLSLNALDFFSSFLMLPSSFKILDKILFSFSVTMQSPFSSFILPPTTRNVDVYFQIATCIGIKEYETRIYFYFYLCSFK